MSTTNLHPMLNIAITAARAAGVIINRASLDVDAVEITVKQANDFVTGVDKAAEEEIIKILLDAFPEHGIWAEESGKQHGKKNAEFVWIIDPLDGTTNFIHGYPVYCVSIALMQKGVLQQAVIYDPNRNDLFYASRGRGAYLNEKRIRVSQRKQMENALISTGFPYRPGDNYEKYLKMFKDVMTSCAGVRRPGAAALDLAYVAAGYADGFFELGLQPWDIAAGALLIMEAGGLIGNFTGNAENFLEQKELIAGNPRIYGQLVTKLRQYSLYQ